MADLDKLQAVVRDLVDLLHLQAKELEKLVTHVEQTTTRLPEPHQFAVVVSELNELRRRLKS